MNDGIDFDFYDYRWQWIVNLRERYGFQIKCDTCPNKSDLISGHSWCND